MRRLTEEEINEKIKKAFILEVGLIPVEVGNSFPMAYESMVHTETRTWWGRLTFCGNHKKNSFVEEI